MQTNKIGHKPEDNIEREILSVLCEADEPITSSQIKDRLGLQSTNPITYRARERLEPAGIVSIGEGEQTHPTAIAPLQITLTQAGEEWCESIDLNAFDANTVHDRIEYLERTVERQEEIIKQLSLITGLGGDQTLPSVHQIRAGYTGVDDAINEASNGDVELIEFVSKWASDEMRSIDEQLD